MSGDERQKIGDWSAQQVHTEHDLVAVPASRLRPTTVVPDDVYGPGRGPGSRIAPASRNGFLIGVAVGLVPLIIGLSVLVGYLMARTGGDTATAGAPLADELADDGAVAAAGVTSMASPGSGSSGGTADATADDSPAVTIAPSASVADGVIRLVGVLPASSTGFAAGLGELAEVLGLDFVDESIVDDDAPPTPALPVSYYSAVLFAEGSDEAFEVNPQSMFEAIAGYLNRGAAQLTVIAYADPADVDGGHVSQHRAAHVKEHLVELGVEPSRIMVVTRDPSEAPISDGPVSRRADLLFQIPS